jgi:hypothetical protein
VSTYVVESKRPAEVVLRWDSPRRSVLMLPLSFGRSVLMLACRDRWADSNSSISTILQAPATKELA